MARRANGRATDDPHRSVGATGVGARRDGACLYQTKNGPAAARTGGPQTSSISAPSEMGVSGNWGFRKLKEVLRSASSSLSESLKCYEARQLGHWRS